MSGARPRRADPCEPYSRLLGTQRPQAAFSARLPGGAVVHPAQTVVAAGARALVSLEWQAARQRVHAPTAGRNLWQSPVPGQRIQHVHYYLAL